MGDGDIRERAVRRLKAKRDFRHHLKTYVGVNLMLIGIWAVTDLGGYFWPVWPLLGWGLGLFFHGLDVYKTPQKITEDEIEREMEVLRRP